MTPKTQILTEHRGWVVPQSGAAAGCVFSLGALTVLGSDPRCHVQLDGAAARAAELVRLDRGGWRVRPLAGDITLDGAPITGVWNIEDGARLRLGTVEVIFKCVADD